jgi:hypothetical protein
MNNNELIVLLREARVSVVRDKNYAQRERLDTYAEKLNILRERIDAALSAIMADEVHWLKPASHDGREFVDDGKHDRETWVKNCITHWEWGHEVYGAANSEREAKAAAFEASKGMR